MVMKVFNRLFLGAIALFLLNGWVMPLLFSEKSNETFLLGLALIVGLVYFVGRSIINCFRGA